MKKRWIITALIIILAFMATIFILNKSSKAAIEVKTASVTRGELVAYLSTSGTVESKNKKDYFGQGKVVRVNAKAGDSVKKGDVLVEFEVQDMSLQLKTAQKQYENTKIQLDILRRQKSSQSAANLPPFGPQQAQPSQSSSSLDDQIKMQENQAEVARLNVESIKQAIGKQQKYIKADFDGVVTSLNVIPGGAAAPQMPVVTLEDIYNLQVAVNVNQYDITRIKKGQEALVKFIGKDFKGEVVSISPVATKSLSQTGTDTSVETTVKLLENNGTLKPGFDVDVNVITDRKERVLKLPAEAVITDKEDREKVYVVEKDTAKLKEIKTGISSDTEAEVINGLREGDRVILNPTPSLKDDVKVNILAKK